MGKLNTEEVKKRIALTGMSQREFATKAGIPISSLNTWLAHSRNLKLKNAEVLAMALRCKVEDISDYKLISTQRTIDKCIKEVTGRNNEGYELNWDSAIRPIPEKADIDHVKQCFPVTWKKRIALIELRNKYDRVPTKELKQQIEQIDNEIKKEEIKEFSDYENSHFTVDNDYNISSSSQEMVIAIPENMATQLSEWLQNDAKTKSISDSTKKQLTLLTSYFVHLNPKDKKSVLEFAFNRAFMHCAMLGLKEMEKEHKEPKLKKLNDDGKL